jgi:superfamily II DNA or RNA helicase
MISLRDVQIQLIQDLRASFKAGHKRVILCAPTGFGKTITFTYIVSEHLKRGGKALIITDRIELLKQTGGAFESFGLKPEMITAGSVPNLKGSCFVGMVETIARRRESLSIFFASLTLIVFDEAHKQSFNKLFDLIAHETFVIGATATPYRDGSQKSLDAFYTDLVQSVGINDLIRLGYLSKPRYFGVDVDLSGVRKIAGEYDPDGTAKAFEEQRIYEGVSENLARLCPNAKALLFAPNVESSRKITKLLLLEGFNAMHLDATFSESERESVLSDFKRARSVILCNVGILTTGFDAPDVDCIILYRATASLPLYLQMIGRGGRVMEGKEAFTILDFGNNVKRHDFWHSEREWSLAKVEKRKSQTVGAVKNCPKCRALVPVSTRNCGYCGFTFKTKKEEQAEALPVELVPLLETDRAGVRLAELAILDLEKQAQAIKAGLVKPYAVFHRLKSYNDARVLVKLIGWKEGWLHVNRKRFPNWL